MLKAHSNLHDAAANISCALGFVLRGRTAHQGPAENRSRVRCIVLANFVVGVLPEQRRAMLVTADNEGRHARSVRGIELV